VEADGSARRYRHRFVWLDAASALRRVSRAFYFHDPDKIEFAAGLAWHPDGKRLVLSYGVGDRESWIATVDAGEVRASLDDAERLPSGISEPEMPVKGADNPTRLAWVPEAPAAGTELMAAGLKERMGDELRRINLQVNHPGEDDGDERPR